MGLFFNRNDGCSGHHFGEKTLKSIGTTSFGSLSKAFIEYTCTQECQHDNCDVTREVKNSVVTGFDTEDELREALKEKVDDLRADISDD